MTVTTELVPDARDATMLILVDPAANSNKFYEVALAGDGTVHIRYGRVGEPGVKRSIPGGEAAFRKTVASKMRKGYKEASVAGPASATKVTSTKARADLSGKQGDPRLTALIDRLVAENAHEISLLSGGKLTVRDGQVSTPLGLLTIDAVTQAYGVLERLAKAPTDRYLLSDYLTLVPQSVGRGRDWTEHFFSGDRTLSQQRDFLDQLKQSIEVSMAEAEGDAGTGERAFAYTLTPVDDKKVVAEIERLFRSTKNDNHPSARMRIVGVYETASPASEAKFDESAAKYGNVKRLWHGTRPYNLLSIFATGLRVPGRSEGIHIAGRMFGDGLYFSEQSTKSLNYSRGGTWSSGVDRRCAMLLADVVMGWEYRPNLHGSLSGTGYNPVLDGRKKDPKTGKAFNSINVKAGSGGVRNHEAIVPGPDRVALRYLVEFEE